MSINKSKLILIFIFIVSIIIFIVFKNSSATFIEVPFTSVTFENNTSEMFDIEGENFESYASAYNGTTYTYPKNYLHQDGIVKYMYDDKNKLKSIAWAYENQNKDDFDKMYNTIFLELVSLYGESDYSPDTNSNYGNVWYLDEGNIVLSAVTTNDMLALQYSYVISD